MLVALAGIVPVLIMRGVFLNSYEKCAVRVRTAEIQNQCTILSNQLSSSGYLTGDISEVMRTELVQLSNIYSGRVMVIDGAFKIQEDTYDMDKGKTIVSGNVIRCFQDKGTSEYNRKNRYIEVTAPIIGKDDAVVGVLLVSAPTDGNIKKQGRCSGTCDDSGYNDDCSSGGDSDAETIQTYYRVDLSGNRRI